VLPLLHCAGQLYATRSTKPTSPHPTPPPPGYAFITRILHSSRAGAGRGRDDGRAPQPGAGSARLRRAWCRYHCWRKETRASSRPWRHSRTARVDDRTQHLPYQEALDQTSALPSPTPSGYALPIPGVNHVRISGDDHPRCCCGRLARWQCAAPAVPTRAEWVVLRAHYARVAQFGVRQPCCRASRAHDLARGIPFPILVTGCWMRSCRSSSRSGMHAIPAHRRLDCERFVPVHQRSRPAPAGGGDNAGTRAGSPRHREYLQSGLTQRDMWVMHSPLGAGTGDAGQLPLAWVGAGGRDRRAGSARSQSIPTRPHPTPPPLL
jgi:hypothetical protein